MRALPEGEALFHRVGERISRQSKLAFVSAFALGLLIHLYMLVNKLPNHDDILGLFIKNESTFSGRWFLFVPSAFSSSFSIPWLTGLLALLWLSLAACCTVRMLRLQKPCLIVLAAAGMVSFPTVYYTLCYLFTADAYLFALLLAALGALCTDRYRFGFLPGGLLLGLSLGCYQAYVFFAVGLFALRLLLLLLFDETATPKTLLVKLAQYAGALLLAALIYRVGLAASLALREIALKTYMGVDGVQSLRLREILAQIPRAYATFFQLYSGKTELLAGRAASGLLWLVSAVSVALLALAALLAPKPHRILRLILSALVLCTLPLVCCGIVLVSEMGVHPLMLYAVCLLYLLPVALSDALSQSGAVRCASQGALPAATLPGQARTLLSYALSLGLAASAFLFAVDANQTYLALELKFDNMMSLVTRMVDRVEQLPEYVPNETPVWYTGTLRDAHYGAIKSEGFARASATDMTGREWNYTALMNNLYFNVFVNYYIGVTFVAPEDAEANAVMETDAYRAMPYYPAAGSVAYIDGIIIVNGGPNPQSPP